MQLHVFLKRTAVVLVAAAAAGCTVGRDGQTYVDGHCVTCLDNPLTGEAINYEKKNPDYVSGKSQDQVSHQKGNIKFSVVTPVDIAYLRIKDEFNLRTRKEAESSWSRDFKYMVEDGINFTYDALPGVSYRMRDVAEEAIGNVRYDVRLETNGTGTDITIAYWAPIPNSEMVAFGESLKQRALKALR